MISKTDLSWRRNKRLVTLTARLFFQLVLVPFAYLYAAGIFAAEWATRRLAEGADWTSGGWWLAAACACLTHLIIQIRAEIAAGKR